MSFTSLQTAAIIAAHATTTKMALSFSFRCYQLLEWDEARKEKVSSNKNLQNYLLAQKNESEYAALLAGIFMYLSMQGVELPLASQMAVYGQIGYVWVRTIFGYPHVATATCAIIRYGGLALAVNELWKLAFP